MTHWKQIIERALKNGWKPFRFIKEKDKVEIFFSHDFCKAFFGEEEVCNYCGVENKKCKHEENDCCCFRWLKSWQYHIQQLALSTDREQYLWEFLLAPDCVGRQASMKGDL